MLVMSRKTGERIFIGQNQDIIITLVEIDRGKVRIGVTAPRDVPVWREEIKPATIPTPPLTTRRQS